MIRSVVSISTRFVPRHILQKFAGIGLRIIAFFYRGKNYEDPITGKTYRKLLPYGRIQLRSNALAPHSMSLERHRLLWLFLKNRTNFFSATLNVLHVAPEFCFLKPFSNLKNLNYITADLNSPWAKVKLDVQRIPFPDNEFDVIICNHVLEHVTHDGLAMQELFRVMKPKGFGIFQVPLDNSLESTIEDSTFNTPELREKHFGQRDHLRLYGRDYPIRLRNAGFEVTESDFVHELSPDLVKRYALPPDEIIYFCKKMID